MKIREKHMGVHLARTGHRAQRNIDPVRWKCAALLSLLQNLNKLGVSYVQRSINSLHP